MGWAQVINLKLQKKAAEESINLIEELLHDGTRMVLSPPEWEEVPEQVLHPWLHM